MRGLEKSMVVFHLFEKLRGSNERSTKCESLTQEKYLEEENGKMITLVPVLSRFCDGDMKRQGMLVRKFEFNLRLIWTLLKLH